MVSAAPPSSSSFSFFSLLLPPNLSSFSIKLRSCFFSTSASLLLCSAAIALFLLTFFTVSLRFPLHTALDIESIVLLLPNASSSSSSSSSSIPSSISSHLSASSSPTTPSPSPSSFKSALVPPPSPLFPPSSSPSSPHLSNPPPHDGSTSYSATNASIGAAAEVGGGGGGRRSSEAEEEEEKRCDVFRGEWVREEGGKEAVLYRRESCPIVTESQDCRGNGRPDSDYENWRWRPSNCDLPTFSPAAFLSLLRAKTLAFVGDSVARNHMESLVCMLWQVEEPINRGSKKMQRWYFRNHDVTIIRIWSSWLVNTTDEPWDYAPANLTKLKLQEPDPSYMSVLPRIDVLVISSGHWYTKRTAFLMGGKIMGGQLWSHKKLPKKRMTSTDAFAIAMKTSLSAIARARGFKGLVVLRTFSPDHYEGGAWDAGGSCTGKTRPAVGKEILQNEKTELMRSLQLEAMKGVVEGRRGGGGGGGGGGEEEAEVAEFRVLDVTPVSVARADGHPGPYRSRDPNKVTVRGADGRPPPQDCLHWCMPGPVDTWSYLLLPLLQDHFASKKT